jgi:hypothetical protein
MEAERMNATTKPARRRCLPARAALAWALLVFGSLQLLLNVALEFCTDLRDHEYALKLAYLREQLAANPGKRLVLLLGNSRPEMGCRPRLLPPLRTGRGEEVLFFNHAMLGCGPVMQRICLQRLLADGIRPDWLIVDCWAPGLHQGDDRAVDNRIRLGRLSWSDLWVMERLAAQPRRVVREWCEERALPWYSTRFVLLDFVAPNWLPWEARRLNCWDELDHTGWLPNAFKGGAAEKERETARALQRFGPVLRDFRPSDGADRALREVLDTCRRERIRTALLYMPESSAFRNLYPPAVREQVERYVTGLSAEYQAPLIDARCWVEDEGFSEGFHLLPEGAARFTERFGREGLPRVLGE